MDLGGHVGDYTSEFKGKYPLYLLRFSQPVNSLPNRVEVNKKSNVVIGGNGHFYSTEHQSSYKVN